MRRLRRASQADARVCAPGSLDARAVHGAVVLCERGGVPRVEKSRTVRLADGAGMVLVNTRRRLDRRRPPRGADRPPVRPRRPRAARVGARPPAARGAPRVDRPGTPPGPGRPVQQWRRPDLVGDQARPGRAGRRRPCCDHRRLGRRQRYVGSDRPRQRRRRDPARRPVEHRGRGPLRAPDLDHTDRPPRRAPSRDRPGAGQPGATDGLRRRPAAVPRLAGRPALRPRPPAGTDAHRPPGRAPHDHQHRPSSAVADDAPRRLRQPGAGQPVGRPAPARAAR